MNDSSSDLNDRIDSLLSTHEGELSRYFSEFEVNVVIGDTKATSHCYVLELDGNGVPPVEALVKYLANNAADFAIPRSKIAGAQAYDVKHRSTRRVAGIHKQARNLFTDTSTSGEGGELLLYLMAQDFLKLPQLLSKMPLKTNSQMHVHGTDGIHVSVESETGKEPILCLYWCESKLNKSASAAIEKCINDLSEYLLVPDGNERRERDLQLVHDHLGENVNNEEFETALINYLKKDAPLSNRVNYRGIGLVGFDFDKYPSIQNTGSMEELKKSVTESLQEWVEKAHTEIKDKKIHTVVIHLFVLPLPSVEKFRELLRTELGK